MGPSSLVRTAYNSQNNRPLSSTVCLNIHPVTHLVSSSGYPSVLAAENFVFNMHPGIWIMSHLQKLSAETSISRSLQPPPPGLLPGTLYLPQDDPDSGRPHAARGHRLEMLTEICPNDTLTNTSPNCSFCNC